MNTDERILCWTELERATQVRSHAFRQPVVMSVDAEGYPTGRVLTLREADEARHMLRFHVDRRSPKFKQWATQPVVGVVFYDGPRKWQIRVKGAVELHFDDIVAREAWDACHPMAKRTYLACLPPGEELDGDESTIFPPGLERRRPTDIESEAGYANFAVVLVKVTEIDSLHLAGAGHRRFQILDGSHKVRRLAP
jgi:pyridoxamine 5'-phosphate oxidase